MVCAGVAMNISRVRCDYCKQPRDFSADLHGCPQSIAGQERVKQLIGSIEALQSRPGLRELTSDDMKLREDRRHEMATALNVIERPVRSEYQQNEHN